jgi:uncharacterized protein
LIISLLQHAEGHLRSIIDMIGTHRPCLDAAQKLHAVEKAIAQPKTLIHDQIENCLEQAVGPIARQQRGPLSGGLMPRSAAIAVLVLCLQLHQVWLGVALVLCFSIGLAITLITAGMIAAIGMRHVSRPGRGWASLPTACPISPASS